jgi:amino acid transporter
MSNISNDDRSGESKARPIGRDDAATTSSSVSASDRHAVIQREKDQFGGIKFGSAFFGWLTATGMAVILTALLAGLGAAVGLGNNVDPQKAAADASKNAETVGIVGAIVLIVILFIAYYCGGYVAGRMARFNGAKQGLAVWLWAIVIAIIFAIVGAIAGSNLNVLANLNSFPRIPINEGALSAGSIITLIVLVAAALVGAILGGLAGMRFHRKVDRAGLGA